MHKKSLTILSISALSSALLASAPYVLADTSGCVPGSGTICNPVNTTLCGLLVGIFNAFMIIGAPIAVLFVIWAGSKFVLARGNPGEIGKAVENLKWTLIGIAIFFGALVITRVIFSTVSTFLTNNNQPNALDCNI